MAGCFRKHAKQILVAGARMVPRLLSAFVPGMSGGDDAGSCCNRQNGGLPAT
jgi:hypothetical protein